MGMGVPPQGAAPAANKPPEELAFAEARAAIKLECRDNVPQLMGETKKLSVAVLEAWDLMLVAGRRNIELNPVDVLRQEMQNQVMAYALMRFLPDEACKNAAEACVAKIPQALQENPPVGKAGLFVRELEALVKDTPRNQAAIQEWLMSQPLFRAMTKTPEAFANLEVHYQECAPKMNQIIQSANESLTSLLQQQSQGQLRPGAQFRPM